MKSIVVSSGVLGMILMLAGESLVPPTYAVTAVPDPHEALATREVDPNEVVAGSCVRCHSDLRLRGNLSLEEFDISTAAENAEVVERMIRKLRAGMMPPPGARAPEGDTPPGNSTGPSSCRGNSSCSMHNTHPVSRSSTCCRMPRRAPVRSTRPSCGW